MFCQKCGQQVPDGSTFCTHCGASLAGGSVPTSTSAGSSSAPGLTQSMPPVAPAPQKPKSKAPIVIAVACAAVVLLGGGTVFALAMLNGSKSSDTQISVIDTGSSDEKDSSAKKKRDKSKESSSSDDEAVSEDESAYYGSGDSDDFLTDVQTYTNDLHPYSMSIPNRFEMEDTSSGSGARYKDPETGFVINLFGYVNINEETAHEMFVDADTSGKADLYTAEGDNWYVVSWREDDTIIYEKTIVTDSTIATAHLEYSTANRDMGSKIIDTLLPTFQVD